MFGAYKVPVQMERDGIYISIKRNPSGLEYSRTCLDEEREKLILSDADDVVLLPVEPVNKPQRLSEHLLIEFGRNVISGSKVTKTIYLTFPVEIGVFVHDSGHYRNIDVMTLSRQKLTLYGDGKGGHICKYWKSKVYHERPKVDPLREGILELEIVDNTMGWERLTRAVFNAYSMKVYFSDKCVSMRARLDLKGEHIAETTFLDSPLDKDQRRAIDMFAPKKLALTNLKFVMEGGL